MNFHLSEFQEPSPKQCRSFWSLEMSEFLEPLCRTDWSTPIKCSIHICGLNYLYSRTVGSTFMYNQFVWIELSSLGYGQTRVPKYLRVHVLSYQLKRLDSSRTFLCTDLRAILYKYYTSIMIYGIYVVGTSVRFIYVACCLHSC